MLQSLLVILLAIWVLRLFQSRQAAPKRPPASDFHPDTVAGDPATHVEGDDHPAFSSGDIVDGEFEEMPGSHQP
jgi:hypothetical protein